jgi:hypothetical protein
MVTINLHNYKFEKSWLSLYREWLVLKERKTLSHRRGSIISYGFSDRAGSKRKTVSHRRASLLRY